MSQLTKPLWKVCTDAAVAAEYKKLSDVAERQYQWALILAQEWCGRWHEDVGEALNNLGDFYMSQERHQEAQDYYRRALDVYNKVFGRDNLVAAMIYRMLAEISLAQGRPREAKILHARALNILEHRQAS